MLRTLLIALALVAATAGTATAASKVLIKSSAQVKNGSLDAADLSAKARASLQGKAGAPGPAGPAGPAGAPGAPGAPGERGPSEAFAARSETPNTPRCPVGGCEGGTVLRRLDLPAGSHLVTASADLAPSVFVANASLPMECQIVRPDTGVRQRALHLYRAGPTSSTDYETVDVTWALTLSAPTTLEFNCSVGTVKFDAYNVRMTALQVATLTETVS